MDKKYLVKLSGRDHIVYGGLLNAAHEQGLRGISVEILQIPNEANGNVAICRTTVETARGIFTDIGDADPKNVGSKLVAHLLRFASTRSKARALRDATNFGDPGVEEFNPDDIRAGRALDDDDEAVTPFTAEQRQAILEGQATLASLGEFKADPKLIPATYTQHYEAGAFYLKKLQDKIATLAVSAGVNPVTGELPPHTEEVPLGPATDQPLPPPETTATPEQLQRLAAGHKQIVKHGLQDALAGRTGSSYTPGEALTEERAAQIIVAMQELVNAAVSAARAAK